MAPYRILVVDDDETLAETLRFNLELEGYEALCTHSAEEALRMELSRFHLILLDVMMDGIGGFRLARMLKEDERTAAIPIIFCTARDTEDDMVAGFRLGADDYIYKPYTVRNILTRVSALLRRVYRSGPTDEDSLTYRGITVDRRSKRCMVDGMEVRLARKELEILTLLIASPGRIFSREEILSHVWRDEASTVLDRTIDVNITRLRSKLSPYGRHIVTRSGYGYGFD